MGQWITERQTNNFRIKQKKLIQNIQIFIRLNSSHFRCFANEKCSNECGGMQLHYSVDAKTEMEIRSFCSSKNYRIVKNKKTTLDSTRFV